jgi:hypothetical protein
MTFYVLQAPYISASHSYILSLITIGPRNSRRKESGIEEIEVELYAMNGPLR